MSLRHRERRARTRKVRIVAQDPSVVGKNGRILTADVDVPYENVGPGPRGHRVHVIDYDASTDSLYQPSELLPPGERGVTDFAIRGDPAFHAENVYAVVMRTLARFEFALGRRVAWGFGGHQLKVAPHAFADANAFYSPSDQALLFGYFKGRSGKTIFTCLSQDVVAHETTHAILDGLRNRFRYPSSPDQSAFHEGFADLVALLSRFSLRPVISRLLMGKHRGAAMDRAGGLIPRRFVTADMLRDSVIFDLGKQLGAETSLEPTRALRRSLQLDPNVDWYKDEVGDEFLESHRRGEILVAAMLRAFVEVWARRNDRLGVLDHGMVSLERVVEEGAVAAETLLTLAIRAIDYTPPVDLTFGDYVSALLTSDAEMWPDDTKYNYRQILAQSFKDFGVEPTGRSMGDVGLRAMWSPPERSTDIKLSVKEVHFEPLQRDSDEVFRFLWANREALELHEEAYTRVISVRPCVRIGIDGFVLRETVAEYVQTLKVPARRLPRLGIKRPEGMPGSFPVKLYGGGALIFDEFGSLKYHVQQKVESRRQTRRLAHLWKYGFLRKGAAVARGFAEIHRRRVIPSLRERAEEW